MRPIERKIGAIWKPSGSIQGEIGAIWKQFASMWGEITHFNLPCFDHIMPWDMS
jgi:hypothetical protein